MNQEPWKATSSCELFSYLLVVPHSPGLSGFCLKMLSGSLRWSGLDFLFHEVFQGDAAVPLGRLAGS